MVDQNKSFQQALAKCKNERELVILDTHLSKFFFINIAYQTIFSGCL